MIMKKCQGFLVRKFYTIKEKKEVDEVTLIKICAKASKPAKNTMLPTVFFKGTYYS